MCMSARKLHAKVPLFVAPILCNNIAQIIIIIMLAGFGHFLFVGSLFAVGLLLFYARLFLG